MAFTTELFGGLDRDTYKAASKSAEWADEATYQSYWAETPQARREKLMPFFWGEWMSQHGSVIGNRALGSQMDLRNRHRFFYPGYSEILTVRPGTNKLRVMTKSEPCTDTSRISQKEWQLPKAQVGVFSSWDTIRYIVEQKAGSLFINSGFEPYQSDDAVIQSFSLLQKETTTPWNSVRHDAYTLRFVSTTLTNNHPASCILPWERPMTGHTTCATTACWRVFTDLIVTCAPCGSNTNPIPKRAEMPAL